jgi:hypothetical protein
MVMDLFLEDKRTAGCVLAVGWILENGAGCFIDIYRNWRAAL